MNAVELLISLVAPPKNPILPSNLDWVQVESRIGRRLPGDYKSIVEIYGQGLFDDFFMVLQPFSSAPGHSLLMATEYELESLREIYTDGNKHFPYRIARGSEGILPWARTVNGDVYWWVIGSGDPNSWPVFGTETIGDEFDFFDMTCSDFLVRMYSGEIHPVLFPDDMPADSAYFVKHPS